MNNRVAAFLIISPMLILAEMSCKNEDQKLSGRHNDPIVADLNAFPTIYQQLIDSAAKVRMNAYAPYSKFLAGSAVLTESGAIYTGCNVENASYGLTNCAERTAIFKTISAGDKKIKAIAIVSDVPEFDAPCGACRQVIYEFGKDIDVVMANLAGKYKVEKISAILPYAFGPESL